MISQDTIQKIQNKVAILDIVGTYVKLKKRGSNYLGLCPFHNEKTPSFTVSAAKEIYKCFGCGKSGNSIGFLMDIEKFSYVEALRWLANKYNIEIEETVSSPELKIQLQTSESLYIINNFAQKFFSEQLWDTEEGKDIALSYLKHRGFKEETIRKFQIGYNPEARDSFAMAASNAQFNTALLLKTGTVVQRDERLQDNYRGRIVFPIHNPSGKVLGFGARIIKKNDKAPKYINTPENEIYVKSKILYGTYFARMAIDKAKECLLVEGYTDVVSLHQAGVENVVASGGTSLTVDQLRLIKKYCDNLTIIYDGDGAGIKAALRGLDLALEERLNVKLVLIPDGEDPDSYVNKVGAEAFAKFVSENKKDFILFQLDIALKDAGTDSAKKATIVNQVAETISKINRAEDFTKRQDYVKQVAQVLKIDEAGLNTLVNKILRDRISKEDNKFNTASPVTAEENIDSTDTTSASTLFLSTEEQNEKALIRNLLEFGNNEWEKDETIAAYILKQIDPEDTFENPQLMEVFNLYKTWYLQGAKPTDKNFLYYENNELSNLVIGLMQSENEELSSKWKEKYESHIPTREDLYKEEVFSSLHYLKLRKIKKLIIENQLEMQQNPSVEQQIIMMQTHLELKELEMRITKELGTVIVK
ncbi:MAG TPA: DNA primase [Ferruginibacter sp.]|nr:DNA primase [Ferruginibacter sp.]HRE63875.1 DNA primase [Ferruginibacter sp.]